MTATWGISENGSANATSRASVETNLGRKFNGVRRNLGINFPIPMGDEAKEFDAGYRAYYRNCNWADKTTDPPNLIPFADVAQGVLDTYLLEGAQKIAALGRFNPTAPYLFSPHHEQNVDQPDQPRPPGTPSDFIAAHRHVWKLLAGKQLLMHQGGPIGIVYCPLQSQILASSSWDMAHTDPGPLYYHVFGTDYYNKRRDGILHYGADARKTVPTIISAASSRGKPWAFFEFSIEGGTVAQENEKAEWLDFFTGILTSHTAGWKSGQLVGLYWTNEGSPTSPGRPDSSAVVIQAMKRMLALPLF